MANCCAYFLFLLACILRSIICRNSLWHLVKKCNQKRGTSFNLESRTISTDQLSESEFGILFSHIILSNSALRSRYCALWCNLRCYLMPIVVSMCSPSILNNVFRTRIQFLFCLHCSKSMETNNKKTVHEINNDPYE